MSGVNFRIELDTRHIGKHLHNSPQMQRLLRKGLSAHVFKDRETLEQVTQAIMEKGEYLGKIRKYKRYGLYFTEILHQYINTNFFKGKTKIPRAKEITKIDKQ